MNKLYDVIEPTVIDDELIRTKCIVAPAPSQEREVLQKGKKEALVEFSDVEQLKFSFLNIFKIENLVGFDKLTKLQLDNNSISKIENLSHLVNLTWLDLSFNQIKKIEGLDTLTKLADLTLANNQIKAFEGLDNFVSLQCVSLGKNLIDNLKQIVGLRKLRNLSVLNLAGNPIDKTPEYKPYVLAHVNNLRYLDYRLVDETALNQAREQYQDEILRLKEEEGASENNAVLEKSEQDRLALLKEANLTLVGSIFAEMMKEDQDIHHYRVFPQMEDGLAEYEERIHLITEDFTKSMLAHHVNHTKEVQQFMRACKQAQSGSDKLALDLIEKFNKNFKRAKRTVKDMSHPTPGEKGIVEELKQQNSGLSNQLLDLEIQLVEQLEEFSKEFERRISDITGAKMEVVQAYFAKLRDTETGFHDRAMSIAMSEMEKFNKDGPDSEMSDATKLLLSDKETLSNMINGSHDVQSLLIDTKEDEMTKFLSKQLEGLISGNKKDEHQRNRNRVSEISLLVSRNAAQI